MLRKGDCWIRVVSGFARVRIGFEVVSGMLE
jgi:hypothetical protein